MATEVSVYAALQEEKHGSTFSPASKLFCDQVTCLLGFCMLRRLELGFALAMSDNAASAPGRKKVLMAPVQ